MDSLKGEQLKDKMGLMKRLTFKQTSTISELSWANKGSLVH